MIYIFEIKGENGKWIKLPPKDSQKIAEGFHQNQSGCTVGKNTYSFEKWNKWTANLDANGKNNQSKLRLQWDNTKPHTFHSGSGGGQFKCVYLKLLTQKMNDLMHDPDTSTKTSLGELKNKDVYKSIASQFEYDLNIMKNIISPKISKKK
eukprot:252427_1